MKDRTVLQSKTRDEARRVVDEHERLDMLLGQEPTRR